MKELLVSYTHNSGITSIRVDDRTFELIKSNGSTSEWILATTSGFRASFRKRLTAFEAPDIGSAIVEGLKRAVEYKPKGR